MLHVCALLARRFSVALAAALLLLCDAGVSGSAAAARIRGSNAEYSNLQSALDAVAAGGVIEVDSGLYEGALVIGKSVTLVGRDTGTGKPKIDGLKGPSAITVKAANVTIDGFEITSSQSRHLPYNMFSSVSEEACVMIGANGASILNSVITGCHFGIYIHAADNAVVAGNEIVENREGGIFILNSRGHVLHDNAVVRNGYGGIGVATLMFPPGASKSFKAVAGDVIFTGETRPESEAMSRDIEISSNTVTDHGHGGIGIGYARHIAVIENTVLRNGGQAVPRVNPPVALSLSENVKGFGIGLNCDSYENTVADNTASDNDNMGILLDSSHLNVIARNKVAGNGIGIQVFGSHGNEIEANSVTANTEFGIRLERGYVNNPPAVANLIFHNDLDANGVNAFDTSGKDTNRPPALVSATKDVPVYPDDLTTPNRWDNGAQGNHFADFDEAAEGFTDTNSDGIGETPHPIPGGKAVDRFPLAQGTETGSAPLRAPTEIASIACSGGSCFAPAFGYCR
jgi:parallel beta-helix repeat protein